MNTCDCGCGGFTNGQFCRGHQWRASRPAIAPPNPSGLCKCGCGEKTKLAEFDDLKRGVVAGHPINYVMGHQSRGRTRKLGPYRKTRERAATEQPNPSGICWCGCGGETPLAKETSRRDNSLMGFPLRYLPYHFHRPNKPMYVIEDRGYETPCWIWQWSTGKAGYGRVTRDGKSQAAHRWMYAKAKGAIPDGKDLDHRCYQPPCVNPDHLDPVIPKVNNDRRRHIKLSVEKAPVIRQLHEWGADTKDIARIFGVSTHTIWKLLAGESWEPRIELIDP